MNVSFGLYVASLILFIIAALSAFSSEVNIDALGLVAVGLACYVASKYPSRDRTG